MTQKNNSEIGFVQVHKKVLAEIVYSAVSDVEGVSPLRKNFLNNFMDFLGFRSFPGVEIHVDSNHDVNINVKIVVRYGMNIPDVGRQVQSAIKSVIDKTADVNIKTINVDIHGVERG